MKQLKKAYAIHEYTNIKIKGDAVMLSSEKTLKILKSFSQECYDFWIREGASELEAAEKTINDIKDLKHDPYEPCGDLIDENIKEEFLTKLKAITYCEKLIEKYDDNTDIEDIDICHIIEILKGRE